MKKQIIAILLSCTLMAGCTTSEQVEVPQATQTPVLSSISVPEITKVTEPIHPIEKEPKNEEPTEVNVIDAATVSAEIGADQLAEPKATEAMPQENGASVTTEPEPVITTTMMVENHPTEPVIKETEPTPTQAPEPVTTETVPLETVPPATESPVTEPPATEPSAEQLDVSALEAYGRSYASDSYGYNGTSECTPDSGAGFFPASTKTITSQEEAERIIQEAIDSQYKRDEAYGYTPYEEVDGETVRCPVNVEVTPTGEPNEYTITVYYGGTS